MPHPAE